MIGELVPLPEMVFSFPSLPYCLPDFPMITDRLERLATAMNATMKREGAPPKSGAPPRHWFPVFGCRFGCTSDQRLQQNRKF